MTGVQTCALPISPQAALPEPPPPAPVLQGHTCPSLHGEARAPSGEESISGGSAARVGGGTHPGPPHSGLGPRAPHGSMLSLGSPRRALGEGVCAFHGLPQLAGPGPRPPAPRAPAPRPETLGGQSLLKCFSKQLRHLRAVFLCLWKQGAALVLHLRPTQTPAPPSTSKLKREDVAV